MIEDLRAGDVPVVHHASGVGHAEQQEAHQEFTRHYGAVGTMTCTRCDCTIYALTVKDNRECQEGQRRNQ